VIEVTSRRLDGAALCGGIAETNCWFGASHDKTRVSDRHQQRESRQQRLLFGAVEARSPCNGKGLVVYVRQYSDRPADQPVHARLWDAIKRNWETYWPTFSHFTVSMTVTTININGPVAWVHGIETSRRRSSTGDVSSSRNYGTNIFINHDGRWLMAFHQSTIIPDQS
jgi:hypothetical protein